VRDDKDLHLPDMLSAARGEACYARLRLAAGDGTVMESSLAEFDVRDGEQRSKGAP
jgi:hypothetical protein